MWLSSPLIFLNEFRAKFSPLCFEGCCCHNTILFPTNPSSQGRWNSCHKSSHSDLGSEKGYFLLRLEMSAVVTRKLYKHHHLEFCRENYFYSVTFINILTVSVCRRQLTIYLWHDWQNSLGFCQKNVEKKYRTNLFWPSSTSTEPFLQLLPELMCLVLLWHSNEWELTSKLVPFWIFFWDAFKALSKKPPEN